MPETRIESVKTLSLDLRNFRTIPQRDEEHAINALITIDPDRFWALMESLLEDGYSPTENIIVLKSGRNKVVKEGNRRVAALKIALGYQKNIEIPDHLQDLVDNLPKEWIKQNNAVPCAVYEQKESSVVDRIVSRTHAKGEKAGRANWTAVAKARYARDQNKQSEPALDLLETYFERGTNVSQQQAERWAGEYPITVLDEALQKLARLLGYKSGALLAAEYPKKNKKLLDEIVHGVGSKSITFSSLRSDQPFAKYGVKEENQKEDGKEGGPASGGGESKRTQTKKRRAYASTDPKSVRAKLKDFKASGKGREKIVTLLDEMQTLRHESHPHAFCFLLRSVLELSAKAYCSDHKDTCGKFLQNKDGRDRPLADALRDITKHITAGESDKVKVKTLHGAMAELARKDGFLSVTSMNQLVHNPSFSVQPRDISSLFWLVFSLIEEMNNG
jgi:hypothetical protein